MLSLFIEMLMLSSSLMPFIVTLMARHADAAIIFF